MENKETVVHTDLYIAELPTGEIGKVECPVRGAQIDSAKNERVKRERYFAWRLLEHAVWHSKGKSLQEIELSLSPSGKWESPHLFLSITHSKDLVAVALSNAPVGIDLEPIGSPRPERFAERVLTEEEMAEYRSTEECDRLALIYRKWTEKESLFKKEGGTAFIPKEIDTTAGGVISYELEMNDDIYFLSVATDNLEDIGFYPNIELT